MVFIETSIYKKQIDDLLTDEEHKELQTLLATSPRKGEVIQGAGGVRKIRFAQSSNNKGKSSGIRVIYFLDLPKSIYLLLAYPKGTKDTLTPEEKRILKQLVSTLKED